MNLRHFLVVLALVALAAAFGCSSNDGPTDPSPAPENRNAGVVYGEIVSGATSFEFLSKEGGDDDPAPGPGRFLVRGSDVHYDTDLGALVFDLTVTNASDRAFPMPVSLTFVSLTPDTVTVLNADNEETGPGAAFYCEFENDDLEWTPGEESLPFTVQLGVSDGVSIGFVTRVDVGMVPGGGTIGGIVWHDLNEDGVIDADEPGLEGVLVRLDGEVGLPRRAISAADGAYRFDGLAAGFYTVTRVPADDLRPTTPPQMQVVLATGEDGDVTDFLAADFGCIVMDVPPEGDIEVGDCIHAKGDYDPETGRLEAAILCRCDHDDGEGEGHHDKHDGADCWSRVCGPVTGIDLDNHTLSVMGATYQLTEDTRLDLDLEDLAEGDRVRVDVEVDETDDGVSLVACRVRYFQGNWDRVRGTVLRIGDDDNGATVLQAVGVVVNVGDDVYCDDDDDEDDDD